jgi:hypothetical protein
MGKMKEIAMMLENGDTEEQLAEWLHENAAAKPDMSRARELAHYFMHMFNHIHLVPIHMPRSKPKSESE